jgi:hypothetical protein
MRRATLIGFVGIVVLVAATGAVATPTPARTYWSRGVEAMLPANASASSDQAASIDHVSCASPGNCGAVGYYYDRDGAGRRQGLLLSETAGKWSRGVEARPPAHSVSLSVQLDDISCTSPGNCTAVGDYITKQTWWGLMLTETDGVWDRGVRAALPANAAKAPEQTFAYVSCWSGGNCIAVGDYYDKARNDRPLLLTEADGVWARGAEPHMPANAAAKKQQASLGGISCPSAGNCTAVGQYIDNSGKDQALLLDETGGAWATAAEAKLPANAVHVHDYGVAGVTILAGPVSCASAGNCSAVGSYDTRKGHQGLLLTESHGTWGTAVEAAMPAGANTKWSQVTIYAISCASASNCSAAGDYTDSSGHDQVVLLTESAGSWSPGVRGLLPGDATHDKYSSPFLGSISCPTAGNCVAAGSYTLRGAPSTPLLLTQTDGVWARGTGVALPRNADAGQLDQATVSCASMQSCSAVGSYTTDSYGSTQGLLIDGPSLVNLVRVPAVKGATLAAAKRSLRAHGCSVGTVSYLRSPAVERGHVISQRPRFGETVEPGTKVNLTVSRG